MSATMTVATILEGVRLGHALLTQLYAGKITEEEAIERWQTGADNWEDAKALFAAATADTPAPGEPAPMLGLDDGRPDAGEVERDLSGLPLGTDAGPPEAA